MNQASVESQFISPVRPVSPLSNSAGLREIDKDYSGQYWLTLTPGQHFKSETMRNGEKSNRVYLTHRNITLKTVFHYSAIGEKCTMLFLKSIHAHYDNWVID